MSSLERLSGDNRTAESEFIRIFQVGSETESPGKRRDFHPEPADLPVDIEGRSLPFHIAAESHYDLDRIRIVLRKAGDSGDQLRNRQVGRADAVDRRNYAPEHMVETMVLSGILYAHDIAYVLHDADRPAVAALVRADRAFLAVGNHHAGLAVSGIVTQMVDCVSETVDVFRRLSKQMQSKAQSAPPAYSGQGADSLDCFLQQGGWICIFNQSHKNQSVLASGRP